MRASLITFLLFSFQGSISYADAVGSLESYAQWVDVTNQPSVGTWTKTDSPNPVVSQGELVTAPKHGSVTPRTGNMILDLRTESDFVSGGDNANYNYTINSDDLGGVNPASVSSGVVSLNFWICPNTWSRDINTFTPTGMYQTTSLLNSSGEVLASIGMFSTGDQNQPKVYLSADGVNWTDTELRAAHTTWTEVTMDINLDAMTSTIGYTDLDSESYELTDVAWDGAITDTSVTTLNFFMADGVGKNYFDDFAFSTAAATAVPEPSTSMLVLVGIGLLATKRRRNAV